MDNRDARNLLSFMRVKGRECRPEGCGPQNLAIKHVRQLLIGRIAMLSRYEVSSIDLGQRLALDLPLSSWSYRVFGRYRLSQLLAFYKGCILDRLFTSN